MTEATTYSLEPGSTFDGETLLDGISFSINETSTTTRLTTDGSRYVNKIVSDAILVTVSATLQNQALDVTKFQSGKNATLVLKGKERGKGSAMAAGTMTFTCDNAVLVDITSEIPTDGAGTVTLNFECWSDDNNYPLGKVIA
jgi:hypothetical protein